MHLGTWLLFHTLYEESHSLEEYLHLFHKPTVTTTTLSHWQECFIYFFHLDIWVSTLNGDPKICNEFDSYWKTRMCFSWNLLYLYHLYWNRSSGTTLLKWTQLAKKITTGPGASCLKQPHHRPHVPDISCAIHCPQQHTLKFQIATEHKSYQLRKSMKNRSFHVRVAQPTLLYQQPLQKAADLVWLWNKNKNSCREKNTV